MSTMYYSFKISIRLLSANVFCADLFWILKECVKRRVMKSLIANPNCSEAASKDAMEAVWDICYNDTQPFDRAP